MGRKELANWKGFIMIAIMGITFMGLSLCAITFADGKKVVIDDAKREIEIPINPERIVVLNSSNMELLYAVGGKAVGRPESTGMPEELYEKVKDLPSIGETPSPNIEKIVSLTPDLLIGVNVSFHHAIIPVIEEAGIPFLMLSINSYRDILDKLKFYGELTGNTDKALTIIKDIDRKFANINEKVSNHKQKKVVIIWGSTESFNMALPTSFVGNLVEILGGANVASEAKPLAGMQRYASLSVEHILSKDPDIVFLITHGYDEKVSEKFKKEFENHPAWKGLRAVKEGNVYHLPFKLFGVNPALRVTDAVEYLAKSMYPEVKF